MMYDIIVFKNLQFRQSWRPHESNKPFSKVSTLKTVFKNLLFQRPIMPFTCGQKFKTRKNPSFKKNIWMRVEGALNHLQVSRLQNIGAIF